VRYLACRYSKYARRWLESHPASNGPRYGRSVHSARDGPAGWSADIVRPEPAALVGAGVGPAAVVRSATLGWGSPAFGRGTGSASAVGPARLFVGVRRTVRLERKHDARVTDVPIVARLNYAS
jgi:hypothetical protein